MPHQTSGINSLDEYLQASLDRYTACLDVLSEPSSFTELSATARFHHLRLDANGRSRWKDLAKNLAYHILGYCFTVSRRSRAKDDTDLMALRDEARSFFRKSQHSGEAGEILLYFLMEAVLKAPQMVSKISLKTNSQLECNGSDGIHMRWNENEGLLDVYFGEAKLYKKASEGIGSMVQSIEDFHTNSMEEFELRLVTRHFKHAESDLKDQIIKFVDRGRSSDTVRVNHACLVGYNWDAYDKLTQSTLSEMNEELKKNYLKESNKLQSLLQRRFLPFKSKRLRFEIFLLPFSSIDDFRNEFLNAL
jgi:hypothetical protein